MLKYADLTQGIGAFERTFKNLDTPFTTMLRLTSEKTSINECYERLNPAPKFEIYPRTKNWEKIDIFDKIGSNLSAPSFHPEGKYVSVVKDGNAIVVMNLKNSAVEQTLDESTGSVTGNRFFMNKQNGDVFMLTNRAKGLVFWDANGLNPFFGKMMSKEVDAKMNEWVKMMQGESMEDYAIRVNDETRAKQQQLFAQEVATALAGDRVSIDNPFVGDYDTSKNMLNIGFDKLGSIALEVPAGEVGDFKDGKNLKFDNAVYVLNDKDEFELAGRTDNNRIVNFKGNPRLIHHFVDVNITSALPHSLRGEIVLREE